MRVLPNVTVCTVVLGHKTRWAWNHVLLMLLLYLPVSSHSIGNAQLVPFPHQKRHLLLTHIGTAWVHVHSLFPVCRHTAVLPDVLFCEAEASRALHEARGAAVGCLLSLSLLSNIACIIPQVGRPQTVAV